MPSPAGNPAALFVGVGIDNYEHFEMLAGITQVVEMSKILKGKGFATRLAKDLSDGQVEPRLRTLLPADALSGGTLVVLWSGHGLYQYGELRLITRSAERDWTPTRTATQLVAYALNTRASQILIILDTCYAGGAIASAGTLIARMREAFPDRVSWVGIVCSARSFEQALDGLFGRELLRLLTEGPRNPHNLAFNRLNSHVSGEELMNVLISEWPAGSRQKPEKSTDGVPLPGMFPNPLYVDRPGLELSGDDLVNDAFPESNLFSAADGPLRELLDWAQKPGPGLHVVVGPAGIGKTSLVEKFRSVTMTGDPQRKLVDAFVKVRRKGTEEISADIDQQLIRRGVLDAGPVPRRLNDLLGALDGRQVESQVALLVIDGLDEANDPAALRADLVKRLSAKAKVIVTTRPPPDYDGQPPLGTNVRILELPHAQPAIRRELQSYLRHQTKDVEEAKIMEGTEAFVRAHSDDGGPFLAARLWARSIAPVLDPDGHSMVDMARLSIDLEFGWAPSGVEGRLGVAELLDALSWAYGAGAPDDVWSVMASAAAGREYSRKDVEWAVPRLGPLVTATSEAGTAVYRATDLDLATAATGRTHRESGGSADRVGMANALVAYYRSILSTGVDPEVNGYLCRYIAQHCIDAGIAGVDLMRSLGPSFRRDLARTLAGVAALLDAEAEIDDALRLSVEAAEIWRTEARKEPALRAQLAGALHTEGEFARTAGDLTLAFMAMSEASLIRHELATENPEYRGDLTRTEHDLALLVRQQQSAKAHEQLAVADPI
ncbi:MAG: ATP-binding protein [Pseudolysinimonas sp.]